MNAYHTHQPTPYLANVAAICRRARWLRVRPVGRILNSTSAVVKHFGRAY
jgi:hypothetical protein